MSHGVHGSVRLQYKKMTSGMHMMPLYFPEIGKLGRESLFCTLSTGTCYPQLPFPVTALLNGVAHADADSQNEWQSVILYGIEGQLMTLLCWSFCWYEPSAYFAPLSPCTAIQGASANTETDVVDTS